MRFLPLVALAFIYSCECSRPTTENDTTPTEDSAEAQSFDTGADDFPIQQYLAREDVKAALHDTKVFTLEIKEGHGEAFASQRQVTIDFVGWLDNGSVFDSTLKRGAPLTFLSGANRVIIGLEQGLHGLKVGGERLIIVPPRLGYGRLGIKGSVPPKSYLIYHITFKEMETL